MASTLMNNLIMQSEPPFAASKEAETSDSDILLRCSVIEYRGETINFIMNPDGHQVFAEWRGKRVDLGLDNIYYKEDMCKYVDRELDLISTFPKFPELQGAQLEWFNNGGYRDIRLKYKGRIMKVFLITAGIIDETFLISESANILYKSGLLDE